MSRFKSSGKSMLAQDYQKNFSIHYIPSIEETMICSNCGYPNGTHFPGMNNRCPTRKEIEDRQYPITPVFFRRKRSTREILRIKFEVLLNEYGAYKAWKENVLSDIVFEHLFPNSIAPTKISEVWKNINPFYWNMLFSWHSSATVGKNIDWNEICVVWREKYAEFKKKNS